MPSCSNRGVAVELAHRRRSAARVVSGAEGPSGWQAVCGCVGGWDAELLCQRDSERPSFGATCALLVASLEGGLARRGLLAGCCGCVARVGAEGAQDRVVRGILGFWGRSAGGRGGGSWPRLFRSAGEEFVDKETWGLAVDVSCETSGGIEVRWAAGLGLWVSTRGRTDCAWRRVRAGGMLLDDNGSGWRDAVVRGERVRGWFCVRRRTTGTGWCRPGR